MTDSCFDCNSKDTIDLYGYKICKSCKSKLLMYKDETIKKWIAEFKPTAEYKTLSDQIAAKLDLGEKKYIKQKIKLLGIQDRLKNQT